MSRKLKLEELPPNRNEKRSKCRSPETAEKVLWAYLNGEITVCAGKVPVPRQIVPSETQLLLHSIFVIGQRVIRKYGKGEIPHDARMEVWRKSLVICDDFEKKGLLPTPQKVFFKRNDAIFQGRRYVLEDGKHFVVPEFVECATRDIEDSVNPLHATAFARFPQLGKKTAARLIEACALRLAASNQSSEQA